MIPDVLLGTVVLTGLSQFPKTDQEVIKVFSRLLYVVTECPSLHRLVNVAVHITLNGRYYIHYATSLIVIEAEVLDDHHSLTRETQGKRLYLFSGCPVC